MEAERKSIISQERAPLWALTAFTVALLATGLSIYSVSKTVQYVGTLETQIAALNTKIELLKQGKN